MSFSHIDPDRLADYASGAAPLPDADAAHLAGCGACRLEVDLVTAARGLGIVQVAGLDAGRIAATVRTRLAQEPLEGKALTARHPGRWLAGLAAAAALVLAVQMWEPGSPGEQTARAGSAPAELSVLHELDDLNEPELEAVLESIPLAAGAVSHPELAPLEELNVNDLERLLRSMEE